LYKHGEHLFKSSFETWLAYPIIAVCTILAAYTGMFTSSAYTLPFFAPFAVYLPLLFAVKLGKFENGVKHLIWWSILYIIAIFFMTLNDEETVKQTVIHSSVYANNKFKWIKYDDLSWNKDFVSSTFGQYFLIGISSLASGGLIGLLIISRELAKMGYYSGVLVLNSMDEFTAFIMSLEIWNILKIIAFLYLIMSLSSFFLYWIMDFELEKRKILKHLLVSFFLIITSVFLQMIFMSPTQKILNKVAPNLPIMQLPPEAETTDFKFYK